MHQTRRFSKYTVFFLSFLLSLLSGCGGGGGSSDESETITNPTAFRLAIEGEGYFSVIKEDGSSLFTLGRIFQQDTQGVLVTEEGYAVDPVIVIPFDAQAITVGSDGLVLVRQPGITDPVAVGQLQAVRFGNSEALDRPPGEYFAETAESGAPEIGIFGDDGFGIVLQGVPQ